MGRLLRIVLTLIGASALTLGSVPNATSYKMTLNVAEDVVQGYDRSLFKHWIDADRDGCNTRSEVLIQEAVKKPKVGKNCKLIGGSWVSPYDGKKYKNSSKLDIDHLVPLAEAWRSGAWKWTSTQRQNFANDIDLPEALVAVTLNLNRSKGDRDVSDWLPPKNICSYINNWVKIKVKYSLNIDRKELTTLSKESEACSIEIEFVESDDDSSSNPDVDTASKTAIPSPEPSSSSNVNSNASLPVITPGAFCSQAQAGQKGQSSKGVTYTCKTSDTENRLRWRQ